MKLRECPFCGEKENITGFDDMVTCMKCNASNSYDWWQSRYDDWRSDGWPEGEVLVLTGGKVGFGVLSKHPLVVVVLDSFTGIPLAVPIEKCKWKPLPGGDE